MFQILQGKFRMLQWGEGTSGIKTPEREKCGSFRRGALSLFRGRPQKNQTLGLAF